MPRLVLRLRRTGFAGSGPQMNANFTPEDAAKLGYRVIRASDCEVGLVCGERGVRTWWCLDFSHKVPSLDDSRIFAAVIRDYLLTHDSLPVTVPS